MGLYAPIPYLGKDGRFKIFSPREHTSGVLCVPCSGAARLGAQKPCNTIAPVIAGQRWLQTTLTNPYAGAETT